MIAMLVALFAIVVLLILIAVLILYASAIPDLINDAKYYFEAKDYKSLIIDLFLLLFSIAVLVLTAIFIIAIIATPFLFRSVF